MVLLGFFNIKMFFISLITSLLPKPNDLSWQLDLLKDRYRFKLVFQSDSNLPLASNISDCNPLKPKLAEDGLPYLVARSYFIQFPTVIDKKLGFKSFSADWMACGHPPLGVFTVAHYDLHFYYINETERNQILCDESPPSPICLSNPLFFLPLKNNIAVGFEADALSGVIRQGQHWYNPKTLPKKGEIWNHPKTVMGSYDGELTFWEPMVPLAFKGAGKWKKQLKYINQTEIRLPELYSVNWNTSDYLTIILEGKTSQGVDGSDRCCQMGGTLLMNGNREKICRYTSEGDGQNHCKKKILSLQLLVIIVFCLLLTVFVCLLGKHLMTKKPVVIDSL